MSVLSFLPIIGTIIDRIIPDKDAAAKAKAELALLEHNGELQLMLEQIKVNKASAQHKNLFVSGARPFILWVCGSAFAYHYLFYPIIQTAAALNGADISHLPQFDLDTMMPVLGGLLGLGVFRTVEKIKKVEDRHG